MTTRADYERHLSTLGSWAELMPPWPVVEEWMARKRAEKTDEELWAIYGPISSDVAARFAGEAEHARSIARALLAETGLTPSEVRSRWPEDAEWLLT